MSKTVATCIAETNQEQNKPQKPGIGMLPDIAGEHPVEKVVVPLARWK